MDPELQFPASSPRSVSAFLSRLELTLMHLLALAFWLLVPVQLVWPHRIYFWVFLDVIIAMVVLAALAGYHERIARRGSWNGPH